jgi:hypothetical protein
VLVIISLLGSGFVILPKYKEEINPETDKWRKIIFDKLYVIISVDAKHLGLTIHFVKKPGCKRKNIDLSTYMTSLNDYLISHPFYINRDNEVVNIFDFKYVKFIDFKELKFSSDEFQIIKNTYPNILSVDTFKCTIDKNVSIGCLNCNYNDSESCIMSLDSLNGLSGQTLRLYGTYFFNENKNVLHLYNVCITFNRVDIDYELFFLTTDAPKLRKIEIYNKEPLNNKDFLFISGFYNLESIETMAYLLNYDQLDKLERLRRIQGVYILDEKKPDSMRKKREDMCQTILNNNQDENREKHHLMVQCKYLTNEYQELRYKLYVERLERVKWNDKISRNDLEQIKKELKEISNMPREMRRNISREKHEYTLFDSLNGLQFDVKEEDDDDDEYVLTNSHLFDHDGIDYYVKSNKIHL